MAGLGAPWDQDDALLHQPAKRDLRRGLAVHLADAFEIGVSRRGAARERAIGRHRDVVLATSSDQFRLVQKRMHLDLVGDERLACKPRRLIEHGAGEIGDADVPGLAVLLGIAQQTNALGQRHLRVVPVNEQQIDEGQIELAKAALDRALEIAGRKLVPIDLGGDEHILARNAGRCEAFPQPFADPLLVLVALCGVDMPIAQFQRCLDRLDARESPSCVVEAARNPPPPSGWRVKARCGAQEHVAGGPNGAPNPPYFEGTM
jgi:hypothetical protein